jgi:hypothetical protein
MLRLDRPQKRLAQPLNHLFMGVRELTSGAVLLIDSAGASTRVLRVDTTFSRAQPVGANGSGPGEYLRASALIPLGGDTIGIRDSRSGARLLIVTPDGTTGAFFPAAGFANPVPFANSIRAADQLGGFYTTARPGMVVPGAEDRGDRAAIVRWSKTSREPKVVAYLPFATPVGAISVAGIGRIRPDPSNIPFLTEPQWAASSDGRVAVVHDDPYRVEIFDSTGARVVNTTPRIDRVRVTEQHRAEWLRWYEAFNVRERIPAAAVRPHGSWPDLLPPFLLDAVEFDLDGNLWVRRTGAAGAPPAYDLFNRAGILTQRVVLPARTRLVGFGRDRAVYLVRLDDVDLEYLERHRLDR